MNRTIASTVKRTKHEERLTIRLSDEQADKIQTLVEAGLYDTKVAFVRESIEVLLPEKLKEADKRTNEGFDYLKLKDNLRALRAAKARYTENERRENAILSR